MKAKAGIGTWLIRIFLIIWSILIIIPFAMMFLTSTKTNQEFYAGIWSMPQNAIATIGENFSAAWAKGNFGQNFLNTVIIVGGALLLALLLSVMISYAIARKEFRGKKTIHTLLLIGLLTSCMVGLTPMFILARFLGLFNTRFVLIILFAARAMPFCCFIMISFLQSIPIDLEEAAMIDGASNTQTFTRIIIPLTRPAFVSAGIFLFIDYWSDYMYGLMFISSKSKNTISMGMLQFRVVSGFKIDWGITCAACVIFIAPILLMYCLFHKQVMGGLTAGSVKG